MTVVSLNCTLSFSLAVCKSMSQADTKSKGFSSKKFSDKYGTKSDNWGTCPVCWSIRRIWLFKRNSTFSYRWKLEVTPRNREVCRTSHIIWLISYDSYVSEQTTIIVILVDSYRATTVILDDMFQYCIKVEPRVNCIKQMIDLFWKFRFVFQ